MQGTKAKAVAVPTPAISICIVDTLYILTYYPILDDFGSEDLSGIRGFKHGIGGLPVNLIS